MAELADTITNNSSEDFLTELEKIKLDRVPKKDYERLELENKKLKNALMNGVKVEDEKIPNAKEIAELARNGGTNLEVCKAFILHRDNEISNGKRDPASNGTSESSESASRVAEILNNIIIEADGDPHVFNSLLSRAMR